MIMTTEAKSEATEEATKVVLPVLKFNEAHQTFTKVLPASYIVNTCIG